VWAVVGVHPNDATETTPQVMDELARLANQDVVVGIGETGLDYYRDRTTPAEQEEAFRQHIELARRTDKALVIHCREAWDDCLDILEDAGTPPRVVMHCFSGDRDVVARCREHGWFMSFAGNVTFKNAGDLRAAAAAAPLDLLLTETDSPYLSPEPHRGKRNEPARIPHVVSQLADVHGVTVGALREQVHANARSAYDLPWGF
jgi:TatD DNase family protein